MGRIGFDNQKYLEMQSKHIRERIAEFGGKLYLEFGGKLFDDFHASRVLPGFKPDSKLQMLLQLKEQAEIIIAINASDIEKNKVRGDLGITYDLDVMRLIDAFRSAGLYVGSVVLTRFAGQSSAEIFAKKLEQAGYRWTDVPEEIRETFVQDSVDESIVDYGNSILYSSARNEYTILRLKRMLRRTVWALTKQLEKGDFVPTGYEVELDPPAGERD